ncbi:hypothetical protein DHEL01_v206126 [Diaporthe helianthi]|uniref:Uncharacterized protein n=1 Tax=Diaporthe helianthi TaxID=158607 RepID=A0A2P5HYZ7_DIAHE|nr:hypothetical protein DHEL01_v206126 [Diaporthe helianthi]
MPEVSAPQQQQPMELAPADGAVVTQQPEAQEQMNTDMSLRGGCGETVDCCGMTESCGCC